jgi:hypothetical protein
MPVRILSAHPHVLNMRTRMPFRYGIASMTVTPHLFLGLDVEIDGKLQRGIAADHLPPKWFTKNPDTPFRNDVDDMIRVIRSACGFAVQVEQRPCVFDTWQEIYAWQKNWGADQKLPPLLWNFGVTLVERAMIDAFCRATGTNFATALRENRLGIRLGDIHPELKGSQPKDFLPHAPLRSVIVRHTVGLSDPLTDQDIPAAERLDDGLPQSLAASVHHYGLTHFKIKLCGDASKDLPRLRTVAEIIQQNVPTGNFAFTLDGNEQFKDISTFRALWDTIVSDAALRDFLPRLLFVEQPMHRDVALSDDVRHAMLAWPARPPTIIDESDGQLDSVRVALECGYVGTSHKNCKGIFKGIANACFIERKRLNEPLAHYIISAEDLCNVGPVALLQDLAVVANLGILHAERNGHHYFKGLSMVPREVQEQVLKSHSDLYTKHSAGAFARLDVRDGRVSVDSIVGAPFGVGFDLDISKFTPLDRWSFDSL